jgi:hypothetical protein
MVQMITSLGEVTCEYIVTKKTKVGEQEVYWIVVQAHLLETLDVMGKLVRTRIIDRSGNCFLIL